MRRNQRMIERASTHAAIARSFGRAAASYDAASELQQLAAQRLLQRLQQQPVAASAPLALDLGCATAAQAAALQHGFPASRFIGIDIAPPMLQQAISLGRCGARYQPVCADACRLPFANHSIDLIFSSFALQWTQPQTVLLELSRVLTAGGRLALSVPLPGSLAEIKTAWAQVDNATHVNPLAAADDWLAAAARHGLRVQDQAGWQVKEHAVDAMTQLARIKATGAQLRLQQGAGLASRQRLAAFVAAYEKQRTTAGLPLSWEVLQLVLTKG